MGKGVGQEVRWQGVLGIKWEEKGEVCSVGYWGKMTGRGREEIDRTTGARGGTEAESGVGDKTGVRGGGK